MSVQEAQLSQRGRAMRRISEYFAKSLKVSKNGTSQKLGCSFLFAFHRNYGCIFAVSTQYTNVTDIQPAGQLATA